MTIVENLNTRRNMLYISSTEERPVEATSLISLAECNDIAKLLEFEENLTEVSLETFIEKIRHHFDLRHIGYLCPSFPGQSVTNPFQLLTYSDDWISHYKSNNYANIDPVIKMGSRSLLPIDWKKLPRTDWKVKNFFGEAAEFGVGRQGITVPVRGPTNGQWALFSVTSNDSDRAWQARHYDLVRNIVNVAYYIHQCAYEMHVKGEVIDLDTITRREREALSWSAEGKAIEDIGLLMAISPETVKAHLDSARHKLGALNRIHAVAKAIRAGLIC